MPEFINPAYLWALPIGAIPVIIYYLMRFRSLRVDWGASYVLERALQKLRKQLYWDQLLLIALRVIACLILVLAFARPTSGVSLSGAADGTHRILIVDGSYSMLAGPADNTRWDQSREIAEKLVANWGRGQVWSLLYCGDELTWQVDGQTLSTPAEALTQLRRVEPGEHDGRLPRAFEAITGKFPDGNLEIYLLADDQAGAWDAAQQIVLPPQTRVYWINPRLDNRTNLAVTKISVANETTLVGHPNRVSVQVRNFSAAAVKNADLEILVDNTFYAREAVALLAGQETEVHVDVDFETAGSHHVAARLKPDALMFDNRLYAGVDVQDKHKVLVLRDPKVETKFASSWDYLATVGRLPEELDEAGDPIFTWAAPEFVLYDKEGVPDFGGYDVVMMDGARQLTAELAAALQDFVRNGGGLLLMADPKVAAAVWNQELGRVNLLPARLVRLHQEELDGPAYQSLTTAGLQEGMAAFASLQYGDLSQSRFYRWYEFDSVKPAAKVLARFSNREPFLVEQEFMPGSVLLMAGGLNGNYNNLIVREFYLPLAFRLISQAAGGGVYPRTLPCNAPVRLQLENPDAVRVVTFDVPGQEPIAIQNPGAVVTVPGGSPVSGLASLLIVRGDQTDWVYFGIQGARADSDLTPISPGIERRLTEELGFVQVGDWAALQDEVLKQRAGNEWHHWLLIILFGALIGEMILQRRFV